MFEFCLWLDVGFLLTVFICFTVWDSVLDDWSFRGIGFLVALLGFCYLNAFNFLLRELDGFWLKLCIALGLSLRFVILLMFWTVVRCWMVDWMLRGCVGGCCFVFFWVAALCLLGGWI